MYLTCMHLKFKVCLQVIELVPFGQVVRCPLFVTCRGEGSAVHASRVLCDVRRSPFTLHWFYLPAVTVCYALYITKTSLQTFDHEI